MAKSEGQPNNRACTESWRGRRDKNIMGHKEVEKIFAPIYPGLFFQCQ